MNITVAGMGGNSCYQGVFGRLSGYKSQQFRFLVDGNDNILFADNKRFGSDGLGKSFTGFPYTFGVGYQDVYGTMLCAQFV